MPFAPLRAAAALVAAEGVALAAVSLGYLVAVAAGHPHNRSVALFGAALGVLAAALLVLLGRALGRGRRWARTPAVLLNLLALPVAVGLLQAGLPAGVAVLLPPLVVLGLLATPSARRPFESPRS